MLGGGLGLRHFGCDYVSIVLSRCSECEYVEDVQLLRFLAVRRIGPMLVWSLLSF